MLRSTGVRRSPVIAIKQTSEITFAALRVNWNKSLLRYPFWCEKGCEKKTTDKRHIQCQRDQCRSDMITKSFKTKVRSWEFSCCSFIKQGLSSLFSSCYVKSLACCYEAQFGQISMNISRSGSVLRLKTSRKRVKFGPLNNFELSTIADGELWLLTFLTASVLLIKSDYLNHSNEDSDWLIVTSSMRV